MNLAGRDKKVIWHPYTQMQTSSPVAIVKGEGAYLFDDSGKRYIDAVSSWWVNIHGHAHPYIAAKVSEQLRLLEHVIFAGFTHPGAIELAERLLAVLPAGQKKIFYSDNGSTAVEVALKMAFQYWHNKGMRKTRIIALKEAYHGDTFGAMSVSGRSAFTNPFLPFLFDVTYIDVPAKHSMSYAQLCEATRREDVAAFIFEPLVQGAAGMTMYEASELERLLSHCRENNVLSIADEVMTGFGRTGKWFATDHVQTKPDIYCLSKGLTGGTMALGITSCTEEVFNAFLSEGPVKTFFHGHSFTANPVACAAALASLDLLEKESCWKDIERITEKQEHFVRKIRTHAAVLVARQKGTILAIEIRTRENTSYFNPVRDQAYAFFMEKGIILRPLGNVIYILPPYCIKNEDLDYIYDSINEFLNLYSNDI